MSQIKITDINLDDSELLNDSEALLNEIEDSEIDGIVGGLSQELLVEDSIKIDLEDIKLEKPIYDYPIKPVKPICWYPKPIKPTCWYPKPIHPIKPYYPCYVIL